MIRAVLFDFGGVLTTSPFEAFARFERARGLPAGFLRLVNSTDPHDNAWARLERGDLDVAGFARAFEAESAPSATGSTGATCWACSAATCARRWSRRCGGAARFATACVTNNFTPEETAAAPG